MFHLQAWSCHLLIYRMLFWPDYIEVGGKLDHECTLHIRVGLTKKGSFCNTHFVTVYTIGNIKTMEGWHSEWAFVADIFRKVRVPD